MFWRSSVPTAPARLPTGQLSAPPHLSPPRASQRQPFVRPFAASPPHHTHHTSPVTTLTVASTAPPRPHILALAADSAICAH